jgi:molybdenum cofactor cytidylyltransferase
MITALLLAAGESKRTKPWLKPLLPFQGKPVIEVIIDKLKESDADEVVIVLGHETEKVKKVIKRKKGINVVINKNYKKGMLNSVKCGAEANPLSNFLIYLVDQPLVKVRTINAIIKSYRKEKIIVPTYKGKKGHPILIPQDLILELLSFKGKTLRDFVHEHKIEEIETEDEGIIINLNTLKDYEKYAKINTGAIFLI